MAEGLKYPKMTSKAVMTRQRFNRDRLWNIGYAQLLQRCKGCVGLLKVFEEYTKVIYLSLLTIYTSADQEHTMCVHTQIRIRKLDQQEPVIIDLGG